MSKKLIMKINVLGATYKVFTDSKEHDERLSRFDGYTSPERKVIVLDVENKPAHQSHVLKHELTHAFLYECGLDAETWAANEEIVDWIALQNNKVSSVYKEGEKKLHGKDRK